MDIEKIGIIEPKDFSNTVIDELNKIGEVSFFDGTDIEEFVKDKEAIFIRVGYDINANLLKASNRLKYICSPTTGLNHIDTKYCRENDIEIISLKGEVAFLETIRATPEHTFGLALSLIRNYNRAFQNNISASWNRDLYKGFEIYNSNVGIIGLGRVGNLITKYFKAFDANVFYYDIDENAENKYGAIQLYSIEEVINKSQIVLLCASYSEENQSFFDSKYIDLLENKFFINTARGELVDEAYLIKKIEDDFFAGVAIDVVADESKEINNINNFIALSKNKNVVLTPHIAGATYNSMWRTEEFIQKKLLRSISKGK